MSLGHERHNQFPVRKGINYPLGLRGGTAFAGEAPGLCSTRDQGVVRARLAAPVAVFIGPLRHVRRVNSVGRQAGDYDRHSGGTARIAADVVGAIGLVLPSLI